MKNARTKFRSKPSGKEKQSVSIVDSAKTDTEDQVESSQITTGLFGEHNHGTTEELWFGHEASSPLPELRQDVENLAAEYKELIDRLMDYRKRHVQPFLLEAANNPYLQPSKLMVQQLDHAIRGTQRLITRSSRTLPNRTHNNPTELRSLIASHRLSLRAFRQYLGVILTASRFQAHTSPRVASTFDCFAGLDQVDEKSDFPFNYSRWHSSLIKNYEKRFASEFVPSLRQFAMVTNSGMAAISLALDIIYCLECSDRRSDQVEPKLGLFFFKGVYYGEAQRAIARFADREHCVRIDCSRSMEEFENILRENLRETPHLIPVLYFDAISPMAAPGASVDFRGLRDAILNLKLARCYVVADVTRIGPTERIQSFFTSDKCEFRIFEAESLAKYHLYGQDYADGGMLRFPKRLVSAFRLPDGSDHAYANGLKALRANNGYSFPDYLAQTLPPPNRNRFFERHATLSRNAEVLWRFLDHARQQGASIEVSFPGDPRHPFFEWSRFLGTSSSLLHFRKSPESNDEKRNLLEDLHLHFHRAGFCVPIRGSYGFDCTSLDGFSGGWVRISAGSEDIELIHMIGRSLHEFIVG